MPAANTPQACTTPASGSLLKPMAMAMSVAAIIVRLRTMETAELSTNLPIEFSTPDSNATTDMHSRYGMVMRVSSTARSNFSGVAPKPRRQAQHQERHGDFGDGGQQQQHEHEARERFLGELARRLAAFAFEPARQTAGRTPS